jgi:hypothetical protein
VPGNTHPCRHELAQDLPYVLFPPSPRFYHAGETGPEGRKDVSLSREVGHRARGHRRTAVKVHTKDLSPTLWRDLEALFGPRGACGGCWCMWWRLAKGERWNERKGAPAKARLRRLVTSGAAHGAVAYHDGAPVGWISYERRQDLPRLDRAPSLACDDAEHVWSIRSPKATRSGQQIPAQRSRASSRSQGRLPCSRRPVSPVGTKTSGKQRVRKRLRRARPASPS